MKGDKLSFKKEKLTKLNKQDLKKVVGGYIDPATGGACSTKHCENIRWVC